MNPSIAELDDRLSDADTQLIQAEVHLDGLIAALPPMASETSEVEKARERCRDARRAWRAIHAEREKARDRVERRRPKKETSGSASSFWISPRDKALPSFSVARRTIAITALSFAYLQYYFIDVQLQIARLPAPVTIFVS